MNPFKERLLNGEKMIGIEVTTNDIVISDALGRLGFDYFWIDTEHTVMDYQNVIQHIISAKANHVTSLVRVPWNESYLAKRILEYEPDGIIFPMIGSVEEAKEAMSACLYPPRGTRGFGPRRAIGYGTEPLEHFLKHADDRVCRFIQIEHFEAVKVLEDILKVPGIDGVIIGGNDLSGSIGRMTDLMHPESLALIDEIIAKCKAAGVPVGTALASMEGKDLQFWYDRGYQFVSSGSDISTMMESASRLQKTMHDIFK